MYNGTKVQCLCVVLGQSAMSENATLNIMGELLTLGAHAQRGLLYLVCVSVCLSVSILAL